MLDFFRLKKHVPASIDHSVRLTEARYVVIDTELTGLNHRKDEIISIGAVKMQGIRIELGSAFHRLIKPEAIFTPESVVIHGITPSDVKQARDIDATLAEFIDFCGGDIVVGHCVLIDMTFINREMKRIFGKTMRNQFIDTFRIYEWLRRRHQSAPCFESVPKDNDLYEIARCFGIPVRGAHDALVDAFISAQLFQRFIPLLNESGVLSAGELCELGNPEKADIYGRAGNTANF